MEDERLWSRKQYDKKKEEELWDTIRDWGAVIAVIGIIIGIAWNWKEVPNSGTNALAKGIVNAGSNSASDHGGDK